MAITHQYSLSLQARGLAFPYTVAIESEGIESRTVTVPPGAPVQVDIGWVNSRLKSIVVSSTQDIILETNSSSAADTTVNLVADKPLIWYTGNYLANPFVAADVVSLFFTNAGADDADIVIETLIDATP